MNSYDRKYEVVFKKTTLFLVGLIIIDIVFLILHVFYSVDILDNKKFKMSYDGGYGEIYQYVKFLSATVILFFLAKNYKSKLLFFWSLLAFFLFLDDWMRFHETIGGQVLGGFMKPFMKGSYHQGQIIYGVIVALFICYIGWLSWRRSSVKIRKLSNSLLAAIGLLWFSAVIVDYIHALWISKDYNLPGVLLEEGGEHVAVSLFLWCCIVALIDILKTRKNNCPGEVSGLIENKKINSL